MRVRARLSFPEGALVHAPVALFALPLPFLVILVAWLRGPSRVLPLVLTWWSVSGAVMMLVDARARRARYERVASLADRRGHGFRPTGLRDTLCGLFMFWALRYRHSVGNRVSIQEGVDA